MKSTILFQEMKDETQRSSMDGIRCNSSSSSAPESLLLGGVRTKKSTRPNSSDKKFQTKKNSPNRNISKSSPTTRSQESMIHSKGGNGNSTTIVGEVKRGMSFSLRSSFKNNINKSATSPQQSPISTTTTIHPNKMDSNTSTDTLDVTLGDEDDPVMVLFQARNTQKVRFSLGDTVPKERGVSSQPMERQESGKSIAHTPADASRTTFNITKFMKGALFGGNSSSSTSSGGSGSPKRNIADTLSRELQSDTYEFELTKEVEAVQNQNHQITWSSTTRPEPDVEGITSDEVPHEVHEEEEIDLSSFTFQEKFEARALVIKLLNKARRAQFMHFRYAYAVKCYVRALELLKEANYPDQHTTVTKTVKLLQNAHFAHSSYTNSANIVKLGIKYEDTGDLVRALKMYTIAYRIRRDNLSCAHPSLVVLLNMLGSIQIKRGELEEAMQIFRLALKDTSIANVKSVPISSGSPRSCHGSSDESLQSPLPSSLRLSPIHYLTRAVTYREMGTVHELWCEIEMAHNMYHASLECMAEYKGLVFQKRTTGHDQAYLIPYSLDCEEKKVDYNNYLDDENGAARLILHDLEETRLAGNEIDHEDEGEEVPFLGHKKNKNRSRHLSCHYPTPDAYVQQPSRYDVFFPFSLDEKKKKRIGGGKKTVDELEKHGDYTDVDVALTIHRIAQLHRSQQEYQMALPAFYVSLRGMKYALGSTHPNVAAILGNIGNLFKEMGNMNAAYSTYQEVLAIESYRLGLSHPDVVVTLHNIATIDAARGNLEHSLSLYTQVVNLQCKLFGEDHESVAVTSACMGDVHERLGDNKSAVSCYEEALRIKIAALGRHAVEVARLLHKLGKLTAVQGDYHLAESYITKAELVYRLNKLRDDDEWVVEVHRDHADVEAAIAMGRGLIFEC